MLKWRCPERKKAGIFNYGGIPMFKGTVKWFNNQKGYGFIQDESGKYIFVHYTGLNMPLQELICSGFFRIIIVCINKCAYIDNMLMLWVIVYRYVDEKQFLQIVEHML